MNAIYAIAYTEAWKFRTSTGFEPVTSGHRCDPLTNWAIKPLTLGGFFLIYFGKVQKQPRFKVKIDGTWIVMTADSGSSVNILDESDLKRWQANLHVTWPQQQCVPTDHRHRSRCLQSSILISLLRIVRRPMRPYTLSQVMEDRCWAGKRH